MKPVIDCTVEIPEAEGLDARELITALRGGVPTKCDFCQQERPQQEMHPEEAGQWACIHCITRWRAQGEQY